MLDPALIGLNLRPILLNKAYSNHRIPIPRCPMLCAKQPTCAHHDLCRGQPLHTPRDTICDLFKVSLLIPQSVGTTSVFFSFAVSCVHFFYVSREKGKIVKMR